MDEKNYWEVTRGGIYAVLHCPHCHAWFDIPNAPGNAESYHFCPGCAQPLEVRESDKYVIEHPRRTNCPHLISREEEYDAEPIGYCGACGGKFIDSMDNIRAGLCECLLIKK
jgi:hypothetical protein